MDEGHLFQNPFLQTSRKLGYVVHWMAQRRGIRCDACRSRKVSSSVSGRPVHYDATHHLYVPTVPGLLYYIGIYKSCRNLRGRVKIIARTENALVTMACFFASRRNGNLSLSSAFDQLEHHRCDILLCLPTGRLEDIEVLGLYEAF